LAFLLLLAVGVGLIETLAEGEQRGSETQVQEISDGANSGHVAARTDPARIEGHTKCVDCHKSEIKAWLKSKHATRAFDLLRTADTAREYAEKLNIRPADIARNSLCVRCHATPQVKPSGHLGVISGVSCEACHGASGGEEGWLNLHAVYGPPGTRREQETDEHFQKRRDACRQAGQLGSAELYSLVKRCFQCHVVGSEKLAEAGHDHGDGFFLVERMLGEIRHNFLLNEKKNAEVATLWTDPLHAGAGRNGAGRKRVLFILGQMVDLEISLRNIATASEENDFSDLMMDRIEDAIELLAEDILDEVEETELPEVEQVVEAAQPIWEKLDDDGFNPDDKAAYLAAAEKVAKAAQAFASRDGNKMVEIDSLDLIPEGPFDGVYQP